MTPPLQDWLATNDAPRLQPFLRAEWRYLALLNYEIDPAELASKVPFGTELDSWQGRTLLSLVGFQFLRTRVLGLRIPFHSDFDEVNLRFYVRRRVNGSWRRAVVFIREIVPRRAIALIARLCYNEPYVTRPMRHQVDMAGAESGTPGTVRYQWKADGDEWLGLTARTAGAPLAVADGTEEEYITEHYWGYTAQRDGGCMEYQVTHPRWRVWQTAAAALEGDVPSTYGEACAEALRGKLQSAFVAVGSPVTVYRGCRVGDGAPGRNRG